MDPETDEEIRSRQAHAKIKEALEELLEIRGDNHGMITDYVISISQERVTENGRTCNYVSSYPAYDQAIFRTLGLLQSCVIRTEALIAGNRDIDGRR